MNPGNLMEKEQKILNQLCFDLFKFLHEQQELIDGVALYFDSILLDGVDHTIKMDISLKKKKKKICKIEECSICKSKYWYAHNGNWVCSACGLVNRKIRDDE